MTTQEKLRLIELVAQVRWNYRLETFTDEALKQLLPALEQAQNEILSMIQDKAAALPEWQEARALALLDEYSDLQLGIRAQLGQGVAEITGIAGAEAYLVHNSILSVGGLVKDFNNVSLTAAQIQAMVTDVPVGGKILSEWVDGIFGSQKAAVQQEIMTGMFKGEGYPEMVRRFREGWGITKDEAVTMTRSYVQTINVDAAHQVAQANKEIVKGWKWQSAIENGAFYVKSGKGRGRGICVTCLSLDSKDEIYPMDGGPEIPAHPRCFTGDTRVSAPGTVAVARAHYVGPIIDIGLDNGKLISVTPNHRILTRQGFKRAGGIYEGDEIVCDRSHMELSRSQVNNYGLPPTFEKIFEFFLGRFKPSAKPSIGEYFHGDGQFIKGDIDIIAPKSFLEGNFKTLVNKDLPDLFLPGPGMSAVDLAGLCKSTAMLVGMGLSTQSLTGGLSVADAFDICHRGKPINGCFMHGSDRESGTDKAFPYSAFRDTKGFGQTIGRFPALVSFADFINGKFDPMGTVGSPILEFISHLALISEAYILPNESTMNWLRSPPEDFTNFFLRLPGRVETRNVEFIRERSFDGHVYDLQTMSSVYYVEGIMSSNCRCYREYVTKSWRELGIPVDEIDKAARPYTIRGKGIDPETGEIKPMSVGTGGRPILDVGHFMGSYEDFLKLQPEMIQKMTLGPGRLELWQSGKIGGLGDLVTIENGKARLLTLKELMQ